MDSRPGDNLLADTRHVGSRPADSLPPVGILLVGTRPVGTRPVGTAPVGRTVPACMAEGRVGAGMADLEVDIPRGVGPQDPPATAGC